MATPYWVDTFGFLVWNGPALLPQSTLVPYQLPGIDGVGYQNIGASGEEFQVVLTNYYGGSTNVVNQAAAHLAMDLMRNLVNLGPVVVWHNFINLVVAFGCRYKVVSVRPREIKSIVSVVQGGGVAWSPAVRLEVEMTLRPHWIRN